LPARWRAALTALPGVVAVHATREADSAAGGRSSDQFTFTVQSTDLRATTPALVGWVRTEGLALASMQAEPVTLTDVFRTLTQRPAGEPVGAGSAEGRP
jgi:hypothetical protein